ncbi:MAG: efflux RND transporter periplasmic adaptor subunit [Flavobacteriales bacterium]
MNYLSMFKVLPILLLVALLSSCGSGNEQQGNFEAAPQETDFVLLQQTDASIENTYPGILEGSVNVDIKAQVSGYLEAIYVKEGDYVQKGQSLFRIKGDVFNEQVNNSNAALKAAKASQATAKLEVEKLIPLVEGKVITDIQLKEAQARYDAATAQVAQARAALGSSQINAAFAVIKAPVSGYIGRIPNRIGNLVTPTDTTPLTTLSEIDNVSVYFSLSEADFIAFNKSGNTSKTVELIMADGSLYNQKGKLEIASGNIDRITGSIAMKAVFPNPDKLLRSGGSGRVIINSLQNNVVKVPKLSVKDIQDKFFVFKLADSGKVNMTPIEVTGSTGSFYIVKTGLKSGDKIALNRIDALTDGSEVIPKIEKTRESSN